MCTLTWWRDSAGSLEVHFNRDELKTCPVAEPPRVFFEGGVKFLSPRDPRGGGTWMLANDRGLIVCLLNRWDLEGRTLVNPQSRGRLVWSLGALGSVDEVERQLVGLAAWQGFTLVVFSKAGDRCFEWDGSKLFSRELPPFLTSSSFQFEEVRRVREASFLKRAGGEEFHASPWEPPSAYSVRMNRADAQTWSRSQVRVSDRISWRYLAEQPDLAGEAEETIAELGLK